MGGKACVQQRARERGRMGGRRGEAQRGREGLCEETLNNFVSLKGKM